jgi:hypothetical protein
VKELFGEAVAEDGNSLLLRVNPSVAYEIIQSNVLLVVNTRKDCRKSTRRKWNVSDNV